jgi:hypothetical protein
MRSRSPAAYDAPIPAVRVSTQAVKWRPCLCSGPSRFSVPSHRLEVKAFQETVSHRL